MADSMRRESTPGTPDVRTLKRIAPYLWSKADSAARARVVIALLFLVIAKLATVATPFFYKSAVDQLAGTTDSAKALIVVAPLAVVLGYGTMMFSSVLFAQLRDAVFANVAQGAMRKLALATFRHIHALSLRYHLQRKTGALSRVIERGVKGIEFLLRFMLFSVIPLSLELALVAYIFYAQFNLWYFVVIVITIFLYAKFTFRVTEWRVGIRQQMNSEDTRANQKAIDSLLNFETVKYFAAEERESARYDQSLAGYEKAAIRTTQSLSFLNAGQSFIIVTGLVIVMTMAAKGVMAGELTVGDFVMVNAFMIQITMPLNFLGTVYREIRQSLIDMRDMFELIDQTPEVVDRPDARDLQITGGSVRFNHVDFHYESDRPILKDVDFTIPAGQTLAVVGPSGAGKSTLSRLLFRFYDVVGGAVEIDGQDIRTVTQASLRRAIGVVPQDTVLFNDTIGYNIAYGREGATEADIIAAAKAAQIHDFITSLPQGYETMVGERGLKLSGGEKQRVAIARTILKNPPILILDEATSALDTATERAIQESLRVLSKNRTVLTIAHRLSTVVDADCILVLDAGRVVEMGRHEDLLAQNGLYAQMWQRQDRQQELAERGIHG